MRVGSPKEIKVHEYRVGLTPESAAELVRAGHEVFLETKAGEGIGAPDNVYEKVGVKILPNADAVFAKSEMIVKVKEPQAVEIARLNAEAYAVHVFALGAGSGAGGRPDEVRRDLHRVRNRHRSRWTFAAAEADVGSRWPDVDPGWCVLS